LKKQHGCGVSRPSDPIQEGKLQNLDLAVLPPVADLACDDNPFREE
jgi:hypothetical protein